MKSHGIIEICADKMQVAMELNPTAAVMANTAGNIVAINQQALEVFGYDQCSELIGSSVEKLIPARYRVNHSQYINGYLKNPDTKNMGAGRDLHGLRKDGTEFPLEIGLKPFKANEEIVVMATVIDISERKRLEALIKRQKEDLMELSTPVINLWDGILVLPIVGTLDSERSRVMVEQLLQALSDSESTIAIVDISGVPTVDTLVAQHLMKAIDASRLMGAECIISGIRPEIANTIVHLGLDLSRVKTKSTMARALHDAFCMLKLKVVSVADKDVR